MIKFIEVSFLKSEMEKYMQNVKRKCSVEAYAKMGQFYDFVCKTVESCQKDLPDELRKEANDRG